MSEKRTTEDQIKETAVKFDSNKVSTHLFPIRAYLTTSQVFSYGAEKYAEGNWKKGTSFHYSRLLDAGDRHRKAFALGQDLDSETKLHHLAHAIACDAMLLELCLTSTGIDDRTESQICKMSDSEIDDYIFNRYIKPKGKFNNV